MANETGKWLNNIDPTSISKEAATLLEQSKAAYKVAKAAREKFEALVKDKLPCPAGKHYSFNYRYGDGFSLGIIDGDATVKTSAKPKQSLQQWLQLNAQ